MSQFLRIFQSTFTIYFDFISFYIKSMYILIGVLCNLVAIMTGVLPFHSAALDWCAFCLGQFYFVVLFLPSSVTVFWLNYV